MRHFLERAWRLVCDDDAPISARLVDVAPDPQLSRLQHKTVRAVTEGMERLRFNTSIARLMELVNALTPIEQRPAQRREKFCVAAGSLCPPSLRRAVARQRTRFPSLSKAADPG